MNIDHYANWTEQTWKFPDEPAQISERDITIMSLGLAGECGEVMEVLKKRLRDESFSLVELERELGDLAYYWARLCRAFGLNPSDVLATNVNKIESRRLRGVVHGVGGYR